MDRVAERTVPVVLHRIVQGAPQVWEDVTEAQLRKMVDLMDGHWAVPGRADPRPGPRWMLTFDDGYASDYEIVFPLLVERNIKATFFLIADKIGMPGYLDWGQVEEMHRHGMCIGSHSRSHRRMTLLTPAEAAAEFTVSKRMLEDRLGDEVAVFSYPYGACTPRLHEAGFASGYRYLCTSAHGLAGEGGIVPRNSIHSGQDWDGVRAVMDPSVSTRMRWQLEEWAKSLAKSALGHERYMKWRDKAFHG